MLKEALKDLVEGRDLSTKVAYDCMEEMMSGRANEISMAAFLTALNMKKASISEITAFARCMRDYAIPFSYDADLLEIVGTGGDGSSSFNILTTTAIVVAAAGIKVAKHGNRVASSKSGAADCLEALGVKIDLNPRKSKELLDKINICFLFAQKYHGAMKHVAKVRKELGIRTIFNVLGPLANPAKANMQLLGVYDESLVVPMADVLMGLGVKRGMVVHSFDGLDEISACGDTLVCEFNNGAKRSYTINPKDFGLKTYEKSELVGGNADENALITRKALEGVEGAVKDTVLMNAGAAMYITKDVNSIKKGIEKARDLIDSGKALDKLEELIRYSKE